MDLESRIQAFVRLGKQINGFLENEETHPAFKKAIDESHLKNRWFVKDHIIYALKAIAQNLNEIKINHWLEPYREKLKLQPLKRIGVVMAGNIPLVGFHDFLCVLVTGNQFIGKLSSKDDKLLKALADELGKINAEFNSLFSFTEGYLKDFDAIIATGSNNTSRYFDYYFGKYPNIIRKNRTSVAILNGYESDKDLETLADDIFLYFGLGCRNVSKIYVPAGYNIEVLFGAFNKYSHFSDHTKYANNYDYNKAIYLVSQTPFKDNGFVLFKEDSKFFPPASVIFYEYYDDLSAVIYRLKIDYQNIQCIVSSIDIPDGIITIPLGKAQNPELWEYSDNIDTINFLINLQNG